VAGERKVRLHVNVDHVATVRQARGTRYPDPVAAAVLCELAGADGITVHLREDRRHIQDRDVRLLRQTVQTLLNLEMAATDEMVSIAREVRPDVVTLVPERREERTTEGGLDAAGGRARGLAAQVQALRQAGLRVSLFIAPDAAQVAAAAALGADTVELHTGEYCEAGAAAGTGAGTGPGTGTAGRTGERLAAELARLQRAATAAAAAGLHVAAGHGLNVHNVGPVAALLEVEELNIGHALVADAVLVGLERAVRDMIAAMAAARRS
jgi:pyridoxine 5-phosphate synthase